MAKNVIKRLDRNLARRLREARKEVGLSTRAVAEILPARLAVSRTTVASYENGTTVPPVDVLAALANAYQRPLNWFLDNREGLSDFRYRNLVGRIRLAAQRQFEAVAAKWADAYVNLQRHLRTRQPQRSKVAEPAGISPQALAEKVRRVFLNLDDDQPVQSIVVALERFSAWALELRSNLGIDGATARHGDEFFIVFNPDLANDRLRMNAAQELAHVIYYDCKQQLQWTDAAVERKAYIFASTLLLPDSQLAAAFEGNSFLRLIQCREKFGISLAAMIHRAEQGKIINTTTYRALWAEISRRGWKENEPGYVWRDRAITFETMLDSAIRSRALTWPDAERVTGIHENDLRKRIEDAMHRNMIQIDQREPQPSTLSFGALSVFGAIADGDV